MRFASVSTGRDGVPLPLGVEWAGIGSSRHVRNPNLHFAKTRVRVKKTMCTWVRHEYAFPNTSESDCRATKRAVVALTSAIQTDEVSANGHLNQ